MRFWQQAADNIRYTRECKKTNHSNEYSSCTHSSWITHSSFNNVPHENPDTNLRLSRKTYYVELQDRACGENVFHEKLSRNIRKAQLTNQIINDVRNVMCIQLHLAASPFQSAMAFVEIIAIGSTRSHWQEIYFLLFGLDRSIRLRYLLHSKRSLLIRVNLFNHSIIGSQFLLSDGLIDRNPLFIVQRVQELSNWSMSISISTTDPQLNPSQETSASVNTSIPPYYPKSHKTWSA